MIVVATTLAAYVMDDPDTWGAWLRTAEAMRRATAERVEFFCAIETDGRGIEPFRPLTHRLAELDGDWWTFSLDDRRTEVTTDNRLRHITTGQNLANDYAMSAGASHMLFMAADCTPPPDTLPKLLEVDHPLVGGEVSGYCLHGEMVQSDPFPLERKMATAAFVLLARDVFTRLRWRIDGDRGWTDDPCLWHDAQDYLGIDTLVRLDVVGKHYPEALVAIEERGHDRTVVR